MDMDSFHFEDFLAWASLLYVCLLSLCVQFFLNFWIVKKVISSWFFSAWQYTVYIQRTREIVPYHMDQAFMTVVVLVSNQMPLTLSGHIWRYLLLLFVLDQLDNNRDKKKKVQGTVITTFIGDEV